MMSVLRREIRFLVLRNLETFLEAYKALFAFCLILFLLFKN